MSSSDSEPRLVLHTDRRSVPAGAPSERFLVIDVAAPVRERDASRSRPPANLAIVLDRSGSMAGLLKLPLAKAAVRAALDRLEPKDRFSVVIYDDLAEVLQAGTAATSEARRRAGEMLARVAPRGTTDLGGGWLAGCEQVAAATFETGVNRVLLLTDGLANRGITDREELARHAAELRARRVCTSTFGLGSDFDEALLQGMAAQGGGHFYFIETAAQIADIMTSEVGEALDVVARDVVVELLLPRDARVEPLTPFPVRTENGKATIRLGDLVSGQDVRIALVLTMGAGSEGERFAAAARVLDADGTFAGVEASIAWACAGSATREAEPADEEVLLTVAKLLAAGARQKAVALNREGAFDEARRMIERAAQRIREIAGANERVRALATELSGEAESMEREMHELDRKRMYYGSSAEMLSRERTGESRRRRTE